MLFISIRQVMENYIIYYFAKKNCKIIFFKTYKIKGELILTAEENYLNWRKYKALYAKNPIWK